MSIRKSCALDEIASKKLMFYMHAALELVDESQKYVLIGSD